MKKQQFQLLQFFTSSPLRNRIIFFFIILAAVPILVLGTVSIYLIDLSHRHDVSSLELQLIDQKTEEIEKFFADTIGILELRVGFYQKSPINPEEQKFLVRALLEENSAFEEVSLIDVAGLVVGGIPTVEGLETAKAIRIDDDLGSTIRFAEEETELLNVSQLRQFKEAAEGNNFIGETYYTLSGPKLTLAAPVRNRNDEIIHVLSAELDLSSIVRSVRRAGLGTSGYLVLVDRNGTLISHGSATDIQSGTDLIQLSRVQRVLSGERLDGLDARDRYESFFGSVVVVGAGKSIPETGWGLFAEWPIEDADAIIQNIRNQVLFLTIFSIAAVIFIASFFATRLVRPIHKLKSAARAIEKGKFKKRVDIKTGDELEELGQQFNKMAKGLKRLQELRDEFVFVAAHEIRSPVTVIKGYISMVLEGDAGKISPEVKDFLGKAQTANERLLKLVFDLLEVARSEAGRIVIEVTPLDMREPTRQSMDELQSLADEKSITLSYEQPEELPLVLGANDRIKEILINLAGNAIKYTAKQGWVKVSQEVRGGYVVTHIQDNGFGMSREAQKKLFQKFYRVKTKETREITGTGLGLFIVKELVEKMKGKISVVSQKGKGSTFSFTLPIAKGEKSTSVQQEERA